VADAVAIVARARGDGLAEKNMAARRLVDDA
jgi:hypothetical protein